MATLLSLKGKNHQSWELQGMFLLLWKVAQRKVYPTHLKKVILQPRNTNSEAATIAHKSRLGKIPHGLYLNRMSLQMGNFKLKFLSCNGMWAVQSLHLSRALLGLDRLSAWIQLDQNLKFLFSVMEALQIVLFFYVQRDVQPQSVGHKTGRQYRRVLGAI